MIILVGASASGKTEVAKELKKKYDIQKVVTHTTRARRAQEIEDVDYHFVDKTLFLKLKEENYFVETTLYNGNYYGTSKKEIADNKCLIVDPNGLHAFQSLHNPHIVTFLLLASEDLRKQRMALRGDSLENIQKRIENDRISFSKENIGEIDFMIDTETLSIEEVTAIVMKHYQEKLHH